MPEGIQCPDCGAKLPPGQPMGLCPRCALKGALELGAATADPHPPSGHPLPSDGRGAGGEGRSFGDYELLEEIARGGMGIVFKARQRKLDRIVAVKMILAGEFASKEQALRFRVEAEAAARLQHPNIVRIHETGEQDSRPYFSMDYVEGGNLASLVREKPLSAKRAAGYVKTIAEAIHYAHEQGILHRDLKPSNVLIDHADQPHITDFGLAKRMTKESFLTVTGDVMGSPSFMPPEQAGYGRSRREEPPVNSERGMRNAEGDQGLVTSAVPKARAGRYSDVYGLGAVLFYLVTGRPPFVAENVAETLHHVLNTEPVSPRLLNPSVPQDIATICLKCLEKEPAKRYRTAQQLADELGRFLNDEPIHARPTSRPEQVWRWCRRKPALAAVAGVTLAGIAASVMFAIQLHHLEHRRVSERRALAMDNALLATKSGELEEAEKAIAAAELAGVPPSDLRLLRGQLAFHRGDHREAIRHLEQASLLSPESVAIPAMLSVAYHQEGEWIKSARLLDAVAKLKPRTPEDYLFKGWVEAEWDSVRGLATLDKAVQLRPSGIALLIRADARANLADDNRDPKEAERATAEMRLVQEMLPTSPLALSVSLMTQLAAANAFRDSEMTRQSEAAVAKAAAISEALKQYPHSQDAMLGRIMYLKYTDDQVGALDVLRQANPQMGPMNSMLVAELYAHGDFTQAIEVTARGTWTNTAASIPCRAYVLAELSNGPERALREFHRFWDNHPPGIAALNAQTVLRLLGRKSEAVAACRSLRQQFRLSPTWRNAWYQTLLEYDCDALNSDELLNTADKSRWNQCEAHFHIGLNRLAEGQRNLAREHFRRAVALKIVYFYEDRWSRAFLARMERDPNWPSWIPVKPEP